MSAPRGAVIRDLSAGGLPWVPYGLGLNLGYPALGAATAALLLLALRFVAWREFKIFDLAILAFFLLVGLQNCCLNLGSLAIYRPLLLPLLLGTAAFVSSLLGRPCTLQYAREMVGPDWWHNYHFIRVNHILTILWGCIFLAMAGLTFLSPALGAHGGMLTGVGNALLFAIAAWFTHWFPRWYRLHFYVPLVRAGKERFIRTPRR